MFKTLRLLPISKSGSHDAMDSVLVSHLAAGVVLHTISKLKSPRRSQYIISTLNSASKETSLRLGDALTLRASNILYL